jgi:GDPmannose 4,6-dehydratase
MANVEAQRKGKTMKKIAFVTGMTGQDGPYLAKLLLEKDYKVYGLIKRYSNPNLDNIKYLGIENDIELVTGDITDDGNMNHLVKTIKPHEFYNLAAQSFVGASWDLNKLTTEVNAIGPLNILNAIKQHSSETKYYQASTSEMYGNSIEFSGGHQDESTPFMPRSPYGVAKLYAYWITVNFRESYSLHASNGILFNHESPIRGKEFVTRKITDGVAKIKCGLADSITLGNLDSKRDWGFAGDFVEAMWLMLQQDQPGDYVVATGVQYTIGDLLERAFAYAGITDWQQYVKSDPRFKRPAELYSLCGDPKKAETVLGWKRKTSFDELVKMMVEADIKRYGGNQGTDWTLQTK